MLRPAIPKGGFTVSPRAEKERAVVQKCLDLLAPLDDVERARVLRTVTTYFDLTPIAHHASSWSTGGSAAASPVPPAAGRSREPGFSGHEPISPKDFLRQKDPKTDVERAMCLAFYLAHFRDSPSFKTADIAKLNTEAAQRKFANTAYTVNNGATTGYFVEAGKGHKQLSSLGDQYVEALPDRAAARAMMRDRVKVRKRRTSAKGR